MLDKRGAIARRLWAVCGLPDFRKVGPMHHARMVRRIFGYIGEGGHIPHEWFAAEVTRLDNVAGDIEALADRLAGVRSWAYIAQRPDWLADPPKWAERTRRGRRPAVSDALHERLTQRFVDRRTAVLVRDIGARGADALPVTVAADGEVSVGPEPIGHLAGFDFRVDPTARLADKRLLLAAAERRLGDELERRAKALLDAPDDAFELIDRRWGWRSAGRAMCSPGSRPGARCSSRRCAPHRALDRLSAPSRAALRGRLEAWLEASIAEHLGGAQETRRGGDRPGELAGCPRAGGDARRCRRRRAAARDAGADRRARARSTAARCTACGSAWGRSTCSCRRCSSRRRSAGGRRLARSARARTMPGLPASGAATLGPEADPRGAALGLSAPGPRMAPDRPCRPARQPRPQGRGGRRRRSGRCRARAVGRPERGRHRPVDDRDRLRPRRRRVALARRAAARQPTPDQRPGHAFAALADLKR